MRDRLGMIQTPMKNKISLILLFFYISNLSSLAEVLPNSLFSNDAVLQRDMEVPVWGTARNGEVVTVEFAGQKLTTTTENGKWMVRLKAMKANATPQTMTIAGDNKIELTGILVGEVWIASGQSNMERALGLTQWQKPIDNWEQEVAAANYPLIRQYRVQNNVAVEPVADAGGKWIACSSKTVPDFSAVGYFFARDLHKALGVPVGIVFSAWGGTEIEAWTSIDSLKEVPGLQASVDLVKLAVTNPPEAAVRYRAASADWYSKYDVGSQGTIWSVPDLNTSTWKTMEVPGYWENAGLPGFDGVVWFRKEVDLPEPWAGQEGILHLGPVDDYDATWVNGVQIGATEQWNALRDYKIPAGVLKAGRNVIAVRVLDTGGGGGIYGSPDLLRLEGPARTPPVPLSGPWLYRIGGTLENTPLFPAAPTPTNPHQTTVLFNGMIAPIVPYSTRGVIWYQGEANSGHGKQYRQLFPLMISDWRRHWGEGDFAFLFVQIAPHVGMTPEIREAQFLTLAKSPNTAMAVITDAGDAEDIHPSHKQVVGARLALAAEVLAYGKKKTEYSGPLFRKAKFKHDKVELEFSHVGRGLMTNGGELKGFTIAGADKNFVVAKAEIKGKKVVVRSEHVSAPVAVRYGWANVPEVNLFNREELPASPFRTDVD